MMMAYDPKETERLKAEAAKVEAARESCAKRIADLYESDTRWGDAEWSSFERLRELHRYQGERLFQIQDKVLANESARPKSDVEVKALQSKPLTRWARGGNKALTPGERIDQQNRLDTFGNDADNEHPNFVIPYNLSNFRGGPQAATLAPDSSGITDTRTHHIDQDYFQTLTEFGGMGRVMSTIYTPHGNDVVFLNNNSDEGVNAIAGNRTLDTANPAGNATDVNPSDLESEGITLAARLYNSGQARINAAVFEDVGFDIGDWVNTTLGRRIHRQLEVDAVQANERANGFVGLWQATKAWTTPANGVFSYDDALELTRQMNEAYLHGERGLGGYKRVEGVNAFICSYEMTKVVKSYKDNSQRPIYIPRVGDQGMYHLHGYPVYWTAGWPSDQVNQENGKEPIAFGNLGYMTQRFCGGGVMISRIYDSATAITNEVRFVGHLRWGVNCLGPLDGADKTLAIVKAQMKAP